MAQKKQRKRVPAAERPLTAQMWRFVDEYVKDRNGGAAYERAGYKARGNAAQVCASKLLKNAKVREAIDARLQEIAAKCDVTAEKLIREAGRIALSDPTKLIGPNGKMLALHELEADMAAAVSSIKINKDGEIEYKLWDKNSAQERLFKHLGLFSEDNRQRNPLADLSREEVEHRVAALLAKATKDGKR